MLFNLGRYVYSVFVVIIIMFIKAINLFTCQIILTHRGEGSLQTTEDLFEASQVSKT